MRAVLLPVLGLAVALGACSRAPTPEPVPVGNPVAQAPAAAHAFSGDITQADFLERVQRLSADDFAGRAPGTDGEAKAVEYIRQQFELAGLQPGNHGEWFQTVPMVETTADPATVLNITAGGKPHALAFGQDMVIGTRTGRPQVDVADSALVFVGYGVDAPERGWNDYAGLDVKGKTVVMLVNDPGFHAGDASLFDGKRMTYYGRWTYKFEEAARKGAAAALIVHDSEGASYGWDVVKNSWSGAQYDLPPADDPDPRLPAQGWITGNVANRLFADAGLDFAQLRAAAGKPGFKPVPMNAKLSLSLKSTTAQKSSRNVIGVLPGSEAPDETVVYMAHWDHLGQHEGADPAHSGGDNIYNGAVDNATGVAGIIEIAEHFKATGAPKRSLVFLAVTLEESGLLGSKYYVAHPAYPLAKTVAVINLDAMPVGGKAKDITVIGKGNSQLEDLLAEQAKAQNRVLSEEATPQDGFYFRSDHFNFAKAGVPALYAKGGADLLDGGIEAGNAAAALYRDSHYHKPSDQYDPSWWKLDGVIQDLQALYGVGRVVADGGQWPNWYEGNPFRAARDALLAQQPAAAPAPATPATPAAARPAEAPAPDAQPAQPQP